MPHPVFQKLVDDLEVAVSSWESGGQGLTNPDEMDFYISLRDALDTYYAEVARR